jgi:tetratricopeptide (TPR) repeat protein
MPNPELFDMDYRPRNYGRVRMSRAVEIVRFEPAAMNGNEIWISARRTPGGWAYLIGSESGREFRLPRETSERPLSFGEVVDLIDGVKDEEAGAGIIPRLLEEDYFGCYSDDRDERDETARFVDGSLRAVSEFYPQVTAWYDAVSEEWAEEHLQEPRVPERTVAATAAAKPEPPAAKPDDAEEPEPGDEKAAGREMDAASANVLELMGKGLEAEACLVAREFARETENLECRAAWWFGLGLEMEQLGKFAHAADFYERGVQLDVMNEYLSYFLFNNLGYSLNQLGQHARAEKLCRRAIEVNPIQHNAWKNLGLALEGQQLYPEAAWAYLNAAQVCAEDPRALLHLEAMIEKQGEGVTAADPRIVPRLERVKQAIAERGGGKEAPAPQPGTQEAADPRR